MTHVTDAIARLPDRDRKPRIEALIEALVTPLDAVHEAAYGMHFWRSLFTAEGETLDVMGRILKVRRMRRDDATYRGALRVQQAVYRSDGLPETLLHIIRLLCGLSARVGYLQLISYPPASVSIFLNADTSLQDEARLALRRAKSAGCSVSFVSSPAVASVLRWGVSGWGSIYGGAEGTLAHVVSV